MSHKFTVGQMVDLLPLVFRPAAPGAYEVRRQMPELDSRPDNPCYRIKSESETHERVVSESELTLAET